MGHAAVCSYAWGCFWTRKLNLWFYQSIPPTNLNNIPNHPSLPTNRLEQHSKRLSHKSNAIPGITLFTRTAIPIINRRSCFNSVAYPPHHYYNNMPGHQSPQLQLVNIITISSWSLGTPIYWVYSTAQRYESSPVSLLFQCLWFCTFSQTGL